MKSKIVTLTIKPELVEEYDKFWRKKGFHSRADATRTAWRMQMAEDHLRRNPE